MLPYGYSNQIDKENGAISQDSAWGGLVKKRLQPLLNLINNFVHASVHPLPDESVDNNDNCDENNKNKNCTRRVHQRPLSLAGWTWRPHAHTRYRYSTTYRHLVNIFAGQPDQPALDRDVTSPFV